MADGEDDERNAVPRSHPTRLAENLLGVTQRFHRQPEKRPQDDHKTGIFQKIHVLERLKIPQHYLEDKH